jgi:hypothetical protein
LQTSRGFRSSFGKRRAARQGHGGRHRPANEALDEWLNDDLASLCEVGEAIARIAVELRGAA